MKFRPLQIWGDPATRKILISILIILKYLLSHLTSTVMFIIKKYLFDKIPSSLSRTSDYSLRKLSPINIRRLVK